MRELNLEDFILSSGVVVNLFFLTELSIGVTDNYRMELLKT